MNTVVSFLFWFWITILVIYFTNTWNTANPFDQLSSNFHGCRCPYNITRCRTRGSIIHYFGQIHTLPLSLKSPRLRDSSRQLPHKKTLSQPSTAEHSQAQLNTAKHSSTQPSTAKTQLSTAEHSQPQPGPQPSIALPQPSTD